MTDTSPDSARELSHALDYNLYSSAIYNQDFKGPGSLTISSVGPTYTFTGKPRGFFAAKTGSLVFRPEDITNVVVSGRTVQFKTALGKSGKYKHPFAFHLKDAAEAQAVAGLLPTTLDTEFVEGAEFSARLDAVAGPQSTWTSATTLIIALNLVAFVIMGCLGAGWFDVASMMPYILYGANNGAATTDGEWWRLLTSMFTHFGLLHLALNMWALFQVGHFVEKLLGRWPYVLAYLASGLAGGLASIAWHGDQSWSAGASGAVFGVYGMILGYMLREKQAMPRSVYQPMLKSTLTFAGYNILYGLAKSGIDNAAHLGGLAGGLAFGWLLALPLDAGIRARDTARRLQLGAAVLAVVLVLGVVLTPRYDYRIKDILAWEEVNKDFLRDEPGLLKRQAELFATIDDPATHDEYAQWLETKLTPFYESWSQKLAALDLDPAKSTAASRQALVNIFDLRAKSLRYLSNGLRAHDQTAVARFLEDDAKVDAALTALENHAAK